MSSPKLTEIEELKKKTAELEERMRKIELEKEEESSTSFNKNFDNVWTAINDLKQLIINGKVAEDNQQPQKDTILVIEGAANEDHMDEYTFMKILSKDRTKWHEIEVEFPEVGILGGSVYLNEEIYVFGGVAHSKELHKLDKNLEWHKLADMNVGRFGITNSSLAWNGYIWVFGGSDEEEEALKSVERYDPKENKWTLMPDMINSRKYAAATIWNDKIIVSGGVTEESRTYRNACFNPENGCWIELGAWPVNPAGHSVVNYKNKAVTMGGIREVVSNEALEDDDPTDIFPVILPPMKYPSSFMTAIILEEEIYAIGGCDEIPDENFNSFHHVQIFNGECWREGPPLPYPLYSASSIIIPQSLADRLCNYQA